MHMTKLDQEWEDSFNFYSEDYRENLLENGEIDAEEEAFMRGYDDADIPVEEESFFREVA